MRRMSREDQKFYSHSAVLSARHSRMLHTARGYIPLVEAERIYSRRFMKKTSFAIFFCLSSQRCRVDSTTLLCKECLYRLLAEVSAVLYGEQNSSVGLCHVLNTDNEPGSPFGSIDMPSLVCNERLSNNTSICTESIHNTKKQRFPLVARIPKFKG